MQGEIRGVFIATAIYAVIWVAVAVLRGNPVCIYDIYYRHQPRPVASMSPSIPVRPLTSSLFVASIIPDFNQVKKGDLIFRIDAFNGAGSTLSVNKFAEGLIQWRIADHRLSSFADAPQIDSESRLTPNYTEEFLLILKQHISPDVADQISASYMDGQQIFFLFKNLKLGVRRGEANSQEERLPLWDGSACTKQNAPIPYCSHVVAPSAIIDTLHGSDIAGSLK